MFFDPKVLCVVISSLDNIRKKWISILNGTIVTLLVCSLLSACGPNATEQRKITEEIAANNKKETKELKEKQEKQEKEISANQQVEYCANKIEAMKTEAREAKKKKNHTEVVEILKPCYGITADGEAVELYITSNEILKLAIIKQDKINAKRMGVSLGMTKEQAIASSWGRPQKVNQSHGSFGTHEQWVYRSGYLYFENGLLTSVQN